MPISCARKFRLWLLSGFKMILDLPTFNNFCTFGLLAANDRKKPQMPQIVQIGPIVQKHTRTTWNCKNEADLTYLGMLDGSFCMLTNKVDLLSRRQEKQIYRLVKIGEEYDKTTKSLKEGFGATLKAIFAGWETPDRYRRWNRLFFSEFVKKQNAHVFLQEMPAGNSKTALNSTKMSTVFPQKVRKFPAKIRKYPQKYANRDFLTAAVHACDKSHQIAACWNENCYFCKLSMLQTNYFQI